MIARVGFEAWEVPATAGPPSDLALWLEDRKPRRKIARALRRARAEIARLRRDERGR